MDELFIFLDYSYDRPLQQAQLENTLQYKIITPPPSTELSLSLLFKNLKYIEIKESQLGYELLGGCNGNLVY